MCKKLKYLAIISLLSSLYITPALSQQNDPLLDRNRFSIGAGISHNSIDRHDDDEIGFQFFAAYDLNQINLMEGVKSSVEFGFMDYGFDRDSDGIWATYVVDGAFNDQAGWLARLGLDIGDDSGLMFGAGIGFVVGEETDLRVEYVIRDEIDSLQLNFLFHL